MMKAVRPRSRLASAAWIRASLAVSSELVASSRTTRAGSLQRARAIASRCRSPWLSLWPPSPTIVS